jgi:hypothetical protein
MAETADFRSLHLSRADSIYTHPVTNCCFFSSFVLEYRYACCYLPAAGFSFHSR